MAGTAALLLALLLTWVTLGGDAPTEVARHAALGAGAGLLLLFGLEFGRGGFYNLLRADLVALLALYGLTLLEFLFDQPQFDQMVDLAWMEPAIGACFLGYAGLAVGRHFAVRPPAGLVSRLRQPVEPKLIVWLFWICFVIGYLNMLIAVDFNVVNLVLYWGGPRFSQPWGRGRLGNLSALFYELSMLLYIVPSLGGVVLARAKRYPRMQVVFVFLGTFITLFYGFTTGTRNVFGAYLISFLMAYLLAQPQSRQLGGLTRNLKPLAVAAGAVVLMAIALEALLTVRTVGFWAYALNPIESDGFMESELFLDYNLWVIATFTDTFPDRMDFLGWEIPYLGLVRPIPRALWSGKPEGMSVAMEEVVGAEQMTVASSLVGEAFMSGGFFGVLIAALFFGVLARWWDGCSSPRNSDLGILVYASGFFAITIAMRSLITFTTGALPTLAAIAYCYWVTRGARAPAARPAASEPALSAP